MKLSQFRMSARSLYYFIMLVVFCLSIFPFYWMFVIGSNETSAINKFPPILTPGNQFITNFVNSLDKIDFFRAIANSFLVAGVTTASVLFFCSLAGFAFAKLHFKGRDLLFAAVVATLMVPTQLGIIPKFLMMSELQWINTLKAVIFPEMVTAYGVFWMRQYISSSISDEILESGRIDGCGNFRLYWNITLSPIRPGLATLGIIQFMGAWNEFVWPLVVLKEKSVQTVQLALRSLFDAFYADYSMILAVTLVSTIPVLVVFLIFSKQFIAGLTEGAVK